ncbi:response regulator [Anaerosoma tenue]|uniref:response regulator n=1 Tax=Anaerosoma tenue TaxID=2933588 RepID=UPI002261023C|nr:response regulator transcription factor [Anaerosoma tenue]MCK8115814.1 response regulator transcription factor [Anaerosoma tenue]
MTAHAPTDHRILVIDDEVQIRRALRTILEARGYDVSCAESGAAAMRELTTQTPDLVVLDLSLPDTDGIELCEQMRTWLAAPILVLSVRSDETDKIAALETGADDYLTKPFSAGELVARVGALLRRAAGTTSAPPVLALNDLTIDIASHRVLRDGVEVTLTPIEFGILAVLAQNADRLVTWSQISDAVWGPDWLADVRTIRVHVSNLRKKIEVHPAVPRYILTEPGVGLRLTTR